MSKVHFYSHLLEIESITFELEKMNLSEDEKLHLASLVDANLHHTILDVILSELNYEDKKLFMEHLNRGEHDRIWQFLNEKVEGVEDKIKKTSGELKKELHKDIKEANNHVKREAARIK